MTGVPPAAAPVVLSLGGSVFLNGERDVEYLTELADLLRTLGRERPLAVTVGGGRTAREYIRLGRALGLTEVELDEVGIDVTRLHARLLAARLGPPTPAHPPSSVREAVAALALASPVVLGGTEPGHTTDAVAALLAVRLRAARVVNATDVDGVYDRDPHGHPEAKRYDSIPWAEFRAIVHRLAGAEAGQSLPFDRLGADLLARAGLPLSVVQGRDLPQLAAAVRGERFTGTAIVP